MKRRRVLVTGPTDSIADYMRAAERAGWEAVSYALLVIEPVPLDRAVITGRFEWIAVTSSSALHSLERACADVPSLRAVPCAVVGVRTAERVRALGFELAFAPADDAEDLARELTARAKPNDRVLWPRGDRSDELARLLSAAGLAVTDVVAYENRPRALAGDPPAAEAVFFASPSAVRAWHDARSTESEQLPHDSAPAVHGSAFVPDAPNRGEVALTPYVAVAIGATTFEALHAETRALFFDIISLPRASPDAFEHVLAHLSAGPSP